MSLLPRKGLLAIAAVIDVALHARGQPVAAKALATRHRLPPRHLEPVLQALVRQGVLKGVRGPRGGYRLAKERRRITVGEIVRIAESLEDGEDNETATPRSELGTRIVTPLIARLQDEVMEKLDAISIEDLCAQAREAGVDCGGGAIADFTI
jgi:Rrf2 family protein